MREGEKMNIGLFGSAMVGQIVGKALVEAGHDVVLGTRSPDNLDEKRGMGGALRDWIDSTGGRVDTLQRAAEHGKVLINATSGAGSIEALRTAGAEQMAGKILIDISNPLDFSQGMPPSLTVCNTDSLGEQIQRAFPEVRVVKTLNTLNAYLMVDPGRLARGDHHIFLSGNDAGAKATVAGYLQEWFGWSPESLIDLGDITTARGTEMILPIWVRLWGALGTPMFNFRIVR